TRQHYEWEASDTLREQMPTLDQPLFTQTLTDDERKALIDCYPLLARVQYSPPATLPQAERHTGKGHRHEDQSLCQVQYTISAIVHPVDVLGYVLLPILPADQVARVYAILNDICTLILHAGGVANEARNNIALRAVNPSFSLTPSGSKDYTMAIDQSKETVSANASLQKTLKDATPSSRQFRRSDPNAS
ncbi:hypothetical protein BX666DRAFT_1830772, partial [Dichotomocladium elegans]